MKFTNKNWQEYDNSVSAFIQRLKLVPVEKFKKALKQKKVLYHINPIYYAFRDFSLDRIRHDKARKAKEKKIIEQLSCTRWTDDLLFVMIESLRDCRKHNVAGNDLIEEGSPFLKAMVKIHDAKSDEPGQLALRALLKNQGLIKAGKSKVDPESLLPDKLPVKLEDAFALYEKLGLDETDFYLKPPAKDVKLKKYQKNDRKYPAIILDFVRRHDGTGTDELGGSEDFYSFQAGLENKVAEHTEEMLENGYITKKSRPYGIQKQFPLKTLFAIGVTASGDTVFLDLKQRDRAGNIPVYYLHHDAPLDVTLYFASFGEYLSYLMCWVFKRKHGVSKTIGQSTLVDGRGSMENVKRAYQRN